MNFFKSVEDAEINPSEQTISMPVFKPQLGLELKKPIALQQVGPGGAGAGEGAAGEELEA